ncbi:MAG: helix-turn-helix transcriptional regulator [Prevotellaceae bacterium]|jgi:transcriptional regulator with XRE-family HTH domain|nr:helix-turn-helix transcriptional regulator [Prevotellaceae bacterium]
MIVKKLRKKLKLSQGKLANLSGINQSHISRIESGKKDPSLSTLEKIANSVGKKVDFVDR